MAFSLIGAALILIGCARSGNESQTQAADDTQRVTLYTSVDDEFARMVVARFEEETGIRVDVLGDTEATKTTGLVTRLQSEKDNPTCDVWWSSEPMGTILLARDGVLEPGGMEGLVSNDWPEALHADDWSWIATAMRSRVIVFAPDRVEQVPTNMGALIDPKVTSQIGLARPQFGTTRIHMALLAAQWGLDDFERWLTAVKAQGVRVYDGNATVVRAVAMGEIDLGLTDTDDVWSGQRNGWNVDMARETPNALGRFPSLGETRIPNTVAIIRNAPNPDAARQLASYLVSPAVERLLHESTSGNTPVNAELRLELGIDPIDAESLPDYELASEIVEQAMDACERVLGP